MTFAIKGGGVAGAIKEKESIWSLEEKINGEVKLLMTPTNWLTNRVNIVQSVFSKVRK